MINIIKRLVSYIIIQIRYWNKLKFPISARIGVRSHFEGANRIYERSFFSGSMGYGSYIAAASYIAGKVGRFTSIAQEVKCNPGCHPYTYPFATTSPMFFSTLKQNGHSFSRKQLYEELRYVDGTGEADIDTGIGFFDHMLNSFARHGLFDLTLKVRGDLVVDCHHTIEDVGIVLGEAIKEAIGDKKAIRRYGDITLPMDEALILCAIDLSGRPYLVFDGNFTSDRVGYFDTQMVKEFFYAVSYGAGMNLHIRQISGENDHHIIEGMFKAFAKALDEATMKDSRIKSVLSTKGTL